MGQEKTSDINIGDIKTRALIDTGSAVSKACEYFVKFMFPKPKVNDLEEIDLKMKVADGRTLPYTGCIESVVKLSFSEAVISTLLIVVPTSMYNKTVPIIVGISITRHVLCLYEQI